MALASQTAIWGRIGKGILERYFWTWQGRVLAYLRKIWSQQFMGIIWEFFGMMEMWVASQPRANRVIPLIEKGIFPRKGILGLAQEGYDKVLEWILRLASHWERKKNQGGSFQVPRLSNHEEAKPDQNQKKKKGKIQGVTNLPPLKKSRPRDLVAQGLNINIPTWGNGFQLGFPFCSLYNASAGFYLTHCLALVWFVSRDPHSDRSYLMYYSDFNPFMSIGLSVCNGSSCLKYLSFANPRVVPHGRVVMQSHMVNRPLSCE